MVEAARQGGVPSSVSNSMPGEVTGSVIQAGTVGNVHFHAESRPLTPAQLPVGPALLAYRDRELDLLSRCRDNGIGPLSLAVVNGPGGVGKTALALHWLHSVRGEYPDGQLYVDLGAFNPYGPVPPEKVLHWFLRALGVSAEDIPAELAQREAAFRSLTATRSLALLLDNAVSAAQVRPLLPATAVSVVVVTSRWRLAGLASHGGQFIELDQLDLRQSFDVLATLVGSDRVRAEPGAAQRIAAACAGLPIALAVIAARLRAHPQRSLAREAAPLEEQERLLELTSEGAPPLHVVFDSSVANLTSWAATLYGLCGLHPASSFGVDVIADVAGASAVHVSDGIDELVESSLLLEETGDRLRFHDLLRLHAHTCAQRDYSQDVQDAVVRAIVEWYLAMAVKADDVIHPHRWKLGPRYTAGSLPHRRFDDEQDAMRWFEQEQEAVRAAFLEAGRRGWNDLVWQFCEAGWGFFLHHRHYQDWIEMHKLGVPAAQHCGQRLAEARLRSQLGYAYAKLRRFDDATRENELALRLAKAEKHDASVATALSQLGRASRGRGEFTDALKYFRLAADVQDRIGVRRGVALCRRRAGNILADLGRYDEAIAELEEAIVIMKELGDPIQHARTLMVLGAVHARSGRPDTGAGILRDALEATRRRDSPYYTAEVLSELGNLEIGRQRYGQATTYLTEARDLYGATDESRAEAVTVLLERLSTVP